MEGLYQIVVSDLKLCFLIDLVRPDSSKSTKSSTKRLKALNHATFDSIFCPSISNLTHKPMNPYNVRQPQYPTEWYFQHNSRVLAILFPGVPICSGTQQKLM